ncbi:MAG: hypothetical protein MH219_14105 [Marinobacter sp.]|jgi:hypothetical protein|nr:hypothetical protein [Marinobacter sp.]
MIPDVNVGGNIVAISEVPDDEAKRPIKPELKQETACLVLVHILAHHEHLFRANVNTDSGST